MKAYFAFAIVLSVLGYLLFGIGGYFIYFTEIQHYAFLFLPFSLMSIYLGFRLIRKKQV